MNYKNKNITRNIQYIVESIVGDYPQTTNNKHKKLESRGLQEYEIQNVERL